MEKVYYVLHVAVHGDYYEWEDNYTYPFHNKELAEVKKLEKELQYKDVSGVMLVECEIEECTAHELGDILKYNEYIKFMEEN